MKSLIKLFSSMAVLILLLMFGHSVLADNNQSFTVNAQAAIAVDASTGKILYDQNSNLPNQGIASITKILTVYMVYKNVTEGKLKWSDQVALSNYAYNLTQNPMASNIPMANSETFSVQDLVNACLLPSANSAAIALAEKIAGTEPKFVDQMKEQLKTWGITDEKLFNASGLNNSDLPHANWYPGSSQDSENTMSAKDVASIAWHLIHDFPGVLEITSKSEITFDKGGKSELLMKNTDYMLTGAAFAYNGLDGLKTGTTALAGTCFVATANQAGFRIITVVLGADESVYGENARFTETQALLDNVYSHWKFPNIIKSGQSLAAFPTAEVIDGKARTVALVASENLSRPIVDNHNPNYQFKAIKQNLTAPIKAGEKLVQVTLPDDDNLGYITGLQADKFYLLAKEGVVRENPIILFFKHLRDKISS